MSREPGAIISYSTTLRATRPTSAQAGDRHDVSGHHRYYGSSVTNGGERIVESRRGRSVNVCGF